MSNLGQSATKTIQRIQVVCEISAPANVQLSTKLMYRSLLSFASAAKAEDIVSYFNGAATADTSLAKVNGLLLDGLTADKVDLLFGEE